MDSLNFGNGKSLRNEREEMKKLRAEMRIFFTRLEPLLPELSEERAEMKRIAQEFLTEPGHGWKWPINAYEVERIKRKSRARVEKI
jgi:hypothetical protein